MLNLADSAIAPCTVASLAEDFLHLRQAKAIATHRAHQPEAQARVTPTLACIRAGVVALHQSQNCYPGRHIEPGPNSRMRLLNLLQSEIYLPIR